MSVAGLDPGVVGDRPEPHLLAALLTPTRAPHARLPKYWKGKLSLRRWSDTRLLVTSLALCFFSPHFFSSERISFSPERPSFAFSSRFFYISERLSSQNVPHAFSRSFLSPRGAVRPKFTPHHWGTVTMTTHALSKKRRASELTKNCR